VEETMRTKPGIAFSAWRWAGHRFRPHFAIIFKLIFCHWHNLNTLTKISSKKNIHSFPSSWDTEYTPRD